MSARPTSSLPVPPSVRQKLVASGFVCVANLQQVRPIELAKEAGITHDEAIQTLACIGDGDVAVTQVQRGITAIDMIRKPRKLISTGSAAIDRILGGGVSVGEVMEFCGPPGIGKTQIGIQVAVNVQRPVACGGLGGQAVYIDTEGSFAAERVADMCWGLIENVTGQAADVQSGLGYSQTDASSNGSSSSSSMSQSGAAAGLGGAAGLSAEQKGRIERNKADALRKRREAAQSRNQQSVGAASKLNVESMLDNIFVYRVYDSTEQLAVNHVLPRFLKAHSDVKLVVIDSVAFHFRHDFEDMGQRTRLLTAYAQALTAIARDYEIGVKARDSISRCQTMMPLTNWCPICDLDHAAVLIINQVTTKFTSDSSGGARQTEIGIATDVTTPVFSGRSSHSPANGAVLVPALGPTSQERSCQSALHPTFHFGTALEHGRGQGVSDIDRPTPRLGPTWAHACTTRCILYWDAGERYARLIKSPTQPDRAVPYKVASCGVTDVSIDAGTKRKYMGSNQHMRDVGL